MKRSSIISLLIVIIIAAIIGSRSRTIWNRQSLSVEKFYLGASKTQLDSFLIDTSGSETKEKGLYLYRVSVHILMAEFQDDALSSLTVELDDKGPNIALNGQPFLKGRCPISALQALEDLPHTEKREGPETSYYDYPTIETTFIVKKGWILGLKMGSE